MQDRIFYSVCAGFVLGVLLRSFAFIDIFTALFIGGSALSLFIFFILISKNKWGVIFSIFIFAFSFGILRLHLKELIIHSWYEGIGEEVVSEGIIVDDPDVRENNQKLTVEEDVSGMITKILITTNLGVDFKYGDKVSFRGKIKKPENFITDQGKEFDYVNYLRKDGILYVINYGDVEVISRGHGNKIKSTLFTIKDKFLEKINFSIYYPENLLMGGLILGEKSAFSQELREQFITTGTIHIIALSGYNITIVAEWFMKLFLFLPQSLGIGMGILSVLLFVLMTGGSSTAFRAGIMAILVLIARATGRNYDVARALIVAGVLMILVNPLVLAYDVSFQLSFIATIAVIFFTPKIEKYFLWVPDYFKMRDITAVTFSAYIFVLPFILYKMGNLSLVALPANVLVLPFIPLTMILGFLTGISGLISGFFSVPIGFLAYLLLSYELWVIDFLANIPFASFSIPNFPLVITVLIYVYFIYRLFGRNIKSFFTERF